MQLQAWKIRDVPAAIHIEHEQYALCFICKVTDDKIDKSSDQKAMQFSGISR